MKVKIASGIVVAMLIAACSHPVPVKETFKETPPAVPGTRISQIVNGLQRQADAAIETAELYEKALLDRDVNWHSQEIDTVGQLITVERKLSASNRKLIEAVYLDSVPFQNTKRWADTRIVWITLAARLPLVNDSKVKGAKESFDRERQALLDLIELTNPNNPVW